MLFAFRKSDKKIEWAQNLEQRKREIDDLVERDSFTRDKIRGCEYECDKGHRMTHRAASRDMDTGEIKKVSHWAHYPGTPPHACSGGSCAEHDETLFMIVDRMQEICNGGFFVKKKLSNRIPNILVEQDGLTFAIEYQHDTLSEENLVRKFADYSRKKIPSFFILNENLRHDPIADRVYEMFGVLYFYERKTNILSAESMFIAGPLLKEKASDSDVSAKNRAILESHTRRITTLKTKTVLPRKYASHRLLNNGVLMFIDYEAHFTAVSDMILSVSDQAYGRGFDVSYMKAGAVITETLLPPKPLTTASMVRKFLDKKTGASSRDEFARELDDKLAFIQSALKPIRLMDVIKPWFNKARPPKEMMLANGMIKIVDPFEMLKDAMTSTKVTPVRVISSAIPEWFPASAIKQIQRISHSLEMIFLEVIPAAAIAAGDMSQPLTKDWLPVLVSNNKAIKERTGLPMFTDLNLAVSLIKRKRGRR